MSIEKFAVFCILLLVSPHLHGGPSQQNTEEEKMIKKSVLYCVARALLQCFFYDSPTSRCLIISQGLGSTLGSCSTHCKSSTHFEPFLKTIVLRCTLLCIILMCSFSYYCALYHIMHQPILCFLYCQIRHFCVAINDATWLRDNILFREKCSLPLFPKVFLESHTIIKISDSATEGTRRYNLVKDYYIIRKLTQFSR